MKHRILCLNAPFPIADLSFDHEIIQLPNVSPTDILEELEKATIVLTAAVQISYDAITNHAPHLQAIMCMGTGVDNINSQACRERGITLCNTPAQNIASVSEHAFALLGALKRRILPLHALTMDGCSWGKEKLPITGWSYPPRTSQDEVVGIIGCGSLGKAIEKLALALGMRVLLAERKGAAEVRLGRTSFEKTLTDSTTIIISAPLDSSTRNMIDEVELDTMRKDAYLVNVGRGGVVNEVALAKALKASKIAGAATDVFEQEPATTENSPLLDSSIPNLILSPHIAWYSATTINGARKVIKANLEAFAAGTPQNVIIRGNH